MGVVLKNNCLQYEYGLKDNTLCADIANCWKLFMDIFEKLSM